MPRALKPAKEAFFGGMHFPEKRMHYFFGGMHSPERGMHYFLGECIPPEGKCIIFGGNAFLDRF
jgi:hypothetical protein